jgi:hypothetical protein
MSTDRHIHHERRIHYVRGVLVSIVAGPVFVFFALNAVIALASTFIGGWLPSQWFSDNAADWVFALGQVDGAANYGTFMISAMVATGCGLAMRWAFTGSVDRG